MKTLELSDEIYAALLDLAATHHCTPAEVLSSLLLVPADSATLSEPLVSFLLGQDFRREIAPAERYFAVLSWIATHHAADFAEFVRNLESRRSFVGLGPEDIREVCREHQARQIPGTPYWAVMNLKVDLKRRFLAELLEYVGYRDALVDFACAAIGPKRPQRTGLRLVA